MERNPIKRFKEVYDRARASGIELPDRVCLATASADGQPSARMVLLKDANERGFVFYTNLESRKSHDLTENPKAALCFYWSTTGEQVRVQGSVELVTDDEADAYFASRTRESQAGAWASPQSREIDSRDALIIKFDVVKKKFSSGDIPRPPHWSGYRLIPQRIEFWKNKPYRLHDRHLYTRDGDHWKVVRLAP